MIGGFIETIESRADYYYNKDGSPNHARLDKVAQEVDAGLWDDYMHPVCMLKKEKHKRNKGIISVFFSIFSNYFYNFRNK